MRFLAISFLLITLGGFAQFDGPGGELGSKSIHKDNSAISDWANAVELSRGWMQINDTSLGKPTVGTESSAVGVFDGSVVSLGDGGEAIISFGKKVINRPGYDFAVFENGFLVGLSYYLELAHVEVSKDGINYVRFPSESLTDTNYQTNNFSYTKPEDIYNLAGKHQAPYGTLFDLEEVGMDTIRYIKIIDVVGSVNDSFGSRDSKGRLINDPFPSPFESSGFDLDAIALVNGSLLSTDKVYSDMVMLYPNKVQTGQHVTITGLNKELVTVYDGLGNIVLQTNNHQIKMNTAGMYYVKIQLDGHLIVKKICVI